MKFTLNNNNAQVYGAHHTQLQIALCALNYYMPIMPTSSRSTNWVRGEAGCEPRHSDLRAHTSSENNKELTELCYQQIVSMLLRTAMNKGPVHT